MVNSYRSVRRPECSCMMRKSLRGEAECGNGSSGRAGQARHTNNHSDEKTEPPRPSHQEDTRGGSVVEAFGRIGARNELFQYSVFERLRGAETDDCLCFNLDCLASGGITAHASLAVRLNRASDSWDDELARALGFFHRELEQFVEEGGCLLLRDWLLVSAHLIGDMGDDLGFAQRCGHRFQFPPKSELRVVPGLGAAGTIAVLPCERKH